MCRGKGGTPPPEVCWQEVSEGDQQPPSSPSSVVDAAPLDPALDLVRVGAGAPGRGIVRAVCRMRPALPGESSRTLVNITLDRDGERLVRIVNSKRTGPAEHFKFDSLYTAVKTKEDVFEGEARGMVSAAARGAASALLAYGGEESGKLGLLYGCAEEPGVLAYVGQALLGAGAGEVYMSLVAIGEGDTLDLLRGAAGEGAEELDGIVCVRVDSLEACMLIHTSALAALPPPAAH
eukprot:CAMPEP_0206246534 /NCGR_PEP_ID=MMETSP0047_2-20121206/19317_1 /ASSEMBLY_ACC=CAM_ASM_000192 /TAXON_ID=195065 /ORGANISM="Chroomonas mesostigmatica_cf, Strain CCMP1168" /LENGTH=234 /DNA_ID=CAMNT_0053671977 /DNA_START=92 /DNA_END=793 /DNA_ORIENTATION=+